MAFCASVTSVLLAGSGGRAEATTDVADHPEFADRKTTRVIDGLSITGWFTEDFTLEELKTLRARERMPHLRPRNANYDDRYEIATFDEVLALARRRNVGVYPETKHPSYFRSIGLSLEEPLLEALRTFSGPVFIQSFEEANLRKLRPMTSLPLIQLLSDAEPWRRMRPREIAKYADGVGPHKDYVIERDPFGALGATTTFVNESHQAGLLVHAWTFRSENFFLPRQFRRGGDAGIGDHAEEYRRFLEAGVDGLFSDYPDHARAGIG